MIDDCEGCLDVSVGGVASSLGLGSSLVLGHEVSGS